MKILLVAMNSIHFVRWTDQLKDSGHEVYWFDILDGGRAARLPWVHQITGWKQKFPNFKGRYFLKKRMPWAYKILSPIFERNTQREFEKTLKAIQPDVVHSIVLYISAYPILKVMERYKSIGWIYSSWGSDLFYFKDIPRYKRHIQRTLPRIDYLITDCGRDISLAKNLGFKGTVLGTFPGGGGFDYSNSDSYIKPISHRDIILIKGYQGRSGRAVQVLKALGLCEQELKGYKVVVFGADTEVVAYCENLNLDFKVLSRANFLPHQDILKLMGEALIYIGNSNSDGMPNTLLEAIAQGAFPIQSNPGGASAEVITHGKNGLLIDNCENSNEIADLIKKALSNSELLHAAKEINQNEIKPRYTRDKITSQVLQAYKSITANITI